MWGLLSMKDSELFKFDCPVCDWKLHPKGGDRVYSALLAVFNHLANHIKELSEKGACSVVVKQ